MTSTNNPWYPRTRWRLAAVMVLACAGLFGAVGCYDTDPRTIDKLPSPELSPDATPCEACGYGEIEGFSAVCAPERVDCEAAGNCINIMRCINDEGCFEGATFGDMVKCGTPCALSQGAKSADDPAVKAGLAIGQCIVNGCADECQ